MPRMISAMPTVPPSRAKGEHDRRVPEPNDELVDRPRHAPGRQTGHGVAERDLLGRGDSVPHCRARLCAAGPCGTITPWTSTTSLRDRRPRWQRLSELLDRVDRRGLTGLRAAEADEFFSLYRLTSSDLSLVQTRTGSLGVTDFLEGLVARAYAPPAGAEAGAVLP